MILDASLWPSRSLDPIRSSGHVRRQSAVTNNARYEVCSPPQSERVYDMIYVYIYPLIYGLCKSDMFLC